MLVGNLHIICVRLRTWEFPTEHLKHVCPCRLVLVAMPGTRAQSRSSERLLPTKSSPPALGFEPLCNNSWSLRLA
eukprot:scaffold5447_cov430-Prasinococcus_capsulatus_cf.AAC.4